MAAEAVPDQVLAGLARAAARGDRDAGAAFVRATQRDVMRFLSGLAHRRDVEDLTQETFLRAFRALPTFAGRSTVRTWLLAIARRVAADAIRHASSRPRLVTPPDWHSAAEPRSLRLEEEHALYDLIAGLQPQRREAFVLTQIAGFSYAEAAQMCDCPVGTIRSRVARAREDLVALLDETRTGAPTAIGEPRGRSRFPL